MVEGGMRDAESYLVRESIRKAGLWKGGGPSFARLDLELTERCSNNCIHCYISQPADDRVRMRAEMSTEKVRAVLDEAAALGCLTIRLTGGEPLLRADFTEIYQYARQLGIKVLLSTNAALLTRETAELFRRRPPGEPVEVSLYGMERRGYEAVSRVSGSFEKAMQGVSLLSQYEVPFRLRGVLLRGGAREAAALEPFAGKLAGAGAAVSCSTCLNLRARRDNQRRNEQIRRLRATPEETLSFLTRQPEAYIRDRKAFAEKFLRPPGDRLFTCGCGQGGAVDAYGSFQPCLLMRHPDTVYDLTNGSMKDALERVFPQMRKWRAADRDYLETCAKCFLHSLCDQCPAWSWMEHGRLDRRVEYLCAVAHIQARYLGLLGKGEAAWAVEDWQGRIQRLCRLPAWPPRNGIDGEGGGW